ncbi:MAG: AsmA family protein [candidate division Zixibacteria bacterium]|nr:AsmA family protein [candidate division Zixibacteria bacterium]
MAKLIPNRRFKRLVFYVAAGIASIILLIAVASIGLRLYFDDNYIRETFLKSADEYINADLYIGDVDISIFSSISLKNIHITTDTDTLFHCDEISLYYSIGRLFSGELLIKSFKIENPEIEMTTDSLGEFNLSWLEVPVDSTYDEVEKNVAEDETAEVDSEFPVSIHLDAFEINSFKLDITGGQSIFVNSIDIAGYNLDIISADSISGYFKISVKDDKDTTILYSLTDTSGTMTYCGSIGLTLDANIYSLNHIKGGLKIEGAPFELDYNGISYSSDLKVGANFDLNLNESTLSINDVLADLNGKEFLSGRYAMGFAENDTILPMEVYVNKARIPLSEINKFIEDDSLEMLLSGQLITDGFKLVSSSEYPGMKMEGKTSIQNANIDIPDIGFSLNDLNIQTSIEGIMYGEDAGYKIGITGYSDSIIYVLDENATIDFSGIDLEFVGTLDSLFIPDSLNGSINLKDLFGDTLKSDIEIAGGLPPNGEVSINIKYPTILIEELPYSEFPGYGEFALNCHIADNDIEIVSEAAAYELTLYFEGDSLWIPEIPLSLKSKIQYNDEFTNFRIEEFAASSPQLFEVSLYSPTDLILDPAMKIKAPINGVIYHDLLEDFIPDKMKDSLGSITFMGESVLQCSLYVVESDDSLLVSIPAGQLNSTITSAASELYEFSLDNTEIDMSFSYMNEVVRMDGKLNTTELSLNESLILPFKNISGVFAFAYKDSSLIWNKASLSVESHNIDIKSKGNYLLAELPVLSMNADMIFNSKETIEIMEDIGLTGRLESRMEINMDDYSMDISGYLKPFNLSVVSPGFFTVKSINGTVPFEQNISFPEMKLKGGGRQTQQISLLDFEQSKYFQRTRNNVDISFQRLETGRIFVENFSLNAEIGNGRIRGYRLYSDVYGGNILGNFEVDLSGIDFSTEELELDSIRYSADFQISSINFDMLAGSKKVSDKSNISGDFSFDGRGIVDPEKEYELEGRVNITRIGSRATKKLLDFLDPTGTDISIAETRKLMDRKLLFLDISYQPKTFSIKIKHGNINPSIDMDQPFFAKYLRIGAVTMPIEYDRKQLQALLEAAAVPIEE